MTDDLVEMEMKELELHQDTVWKRFPQHYFPMPVIEPMNVTTYERHSYGRRCAKQIRHR
jgi:hypothetical protein